MTENDRIADLETRLNDMSGQIVDLEADLAESRDALKFMTGHCAALDANWEKTHEIAMAPIRDALGFNEDATVYEMVAEIRRLKRGENDQRNQ